MDDIDELVGRTEEAAAALMRGDIERYLELTHHADGYTLMDPFGGPAVRYENRADTVRESAGYFKGGDAKLEVAEVHAWDDTAVLVMIERQHGEVGDLPEQDWSLRVTQVFRREGDDWKLVHRHADPLVHPIDLPHLGALARGERPEQDSNLRPTP